MPETPALTGDVEFVMNILQVPVVAQEGVELLEVELLFATSASALAVVVLSLLFDSQETSVK